MAEPALAAVEAASHSFANSELSSLLPLDDALAKLIEISRESDGRDSLAECLAVTRITNLLPDLSAHCPELFLLRRYKDEAGNVGIQGGDKNQNGSAPAGASSSEHHRGPEKLKGDPETMQALVSSSSLRPLVQALRVLRNLCAGSAASQDSFLQEGATDAVATIVDSLIAAGVQNQEFHESCSTADVITAKGPGVFGRSKSEGTWTGGGGGGTEGKRKTKAPPAGGVGDAAGVSSLSSIIQELQELKAAAAAAEEEVEGEEDPAVDQLPQPAATGRWAALEVQEPEGDSGSSFHGSGIGKGGLGAAEVFPPPPPPSTPVASAAPPAALSSGPPRKFATPPIGRKSRSISRSSNKGLSIPITKSPMTAAVFSPSSTPSPSARLPHTPSSPIPPSPSPLFSSFKIVLSPDYSDAVKASLQLLGNFCNGGETNQSAVWDRLFPGTFSRLAVIQSEAVFDPLCMVLFTCCKGSKKRTDEIVSSSEGVATIAALLRSAGREYNEKGSQSGSSPPINTWLSLLVQHLCLSSPFLLQIFRSLLKYSPPPLLGEVRGPFCPEQAVLLWYLSDIIHAAYPATVDPKDSVVFKGRTGQISTLACSFDAKVVGKLMLDLIRESSKAERTQTAKTAKDGQASPPSLKLGPLPLAFDLPNSSANVLGLSLQILRSICSIESPETPPGSSFSSIFQQSDLIGLLLDLLRSLGPPKRAAAKQDNDESSAQAGGTSAAFMDFPSYLPYLGYRRDLLSVLANYCHRRKDAQDEVREKDGLFLILQHCVHDEQNPLMREWGLWAVRNLLEGNEENQRLVGELQVQGSVDSPELQAMGLKVVVDSSSGKASLQNIGSGEQS